MLLNFLKFLNRQNRRKSLLALVLTSTALQGCATYHFGHYKRTIPGGYDRVAIPVFQNPTPITGIESFFTQSLRMEFERSGLAVVESKADAQVILEGKIVSVQFVGSNPTSYDTDQTGIQTPNAPPYPTAGYTTSAPYPNPLPSRTTLNKTYASQVVVQVTAKKVADNSVLWQGVFNSSRNYSTPLLGTPSLTGASALYNENSRVDTIQKQASDMMSEAHDRFTENF